MWCFCCQNPGGLAGAFGTSSKPPRPATENVASECVPPHRMFVWEFGLRVFIRAINSPICSAISSSHACGTFIYWNSRPTIPPAFRSDLSSNRCIQHMHIMHGYIVCVCKCVVCGVVCIRWDFERFWLLHPPQLNCFSVRCLLERFNYFNFDLRTRNALTFGKACPHLSDRDAVYEAALAESSKHIP